MARTTFVQADLILGANSLVSFDDAEYQASVDGNDDWFLLSESQKVASLIKAYQRIRRMNFCLDPEEFTWVDSDGNERSDIDFSQMTTDIFNTLPQALKDAFAQASFVTIADEDDCDNFEQQRADGVIQSKTGDISQMYNPKKPLSYPIPRKAVEILAPWLCRNKVSLARSS